VALTPGSTVGTVLVLRALGLGDLLTGMPALRGLRRAYPAARVVLATPQPLAPLAMLSGAVDEVLPTSRLGELHWRGASPDLAVNLHGRGPQSIGDLLTTKPKELISHGNSAYPSVHGPPWRDDIHEVDRWCALLGAAGIACDATDLALSRPPGHPHRDGVVVIHPGAAAPSRRWPADRFAMVAAALTTAGHRVVLTGSAAEKPLADAIAAEAGLSENCVLAGQLDVLGMVALVSDCRLLICGDTGVAHIATATGTPSVLLFGPTAPDRWGPRGDGRHVTMWAGIPGDPHGQRTDPGLLLISAAQVLDATRQILAECA
jgi:ADP-heptose:LPS heptosyltransferase